MIAASLTYLVRLGLFVGLTVGLVHGVAAGFRALCDWCEISEDFQ
jgi:hypothetical protein